MKLGPIQKKWVKSLKENGHRQTTRRLGEKTKNDYTACCLGELGLIAGVCRFDNHGILREKGSDNSETLYDSYESLGLNSPTGEFDITDTEFSSFALLNDNEHTWYEIACYVEAYPELFFNKSV